MADYTAYQVFPTDRHTMHEVEELLQKEGILLDPHLDYTCAVSDDLGEVIATGSLFGNTLRCFAVRSDHQGEGLLNIIVSHLIEKEASLGRTHLFLYTKPSADGFFRDIGFHEIARVENRLVFMENRHDGFAKYLSEISKETRLGNCSAIVMNANPFTKGHRFLAEYASRNSDFVHVFIVSEDKSLFPWAVRKKLVLDGLQGIGNVICHDSGPYIISSATFPSYFLKEPDLVAKTHALLDIKVFVKIAAALNISTRYIGQEPCSRVTALYNEVMKRELPANQIRCVEIPRYENHGKIVSASTVREAIVQDDFEVLEDMLPPTTLAYLKSPEAQSVIDRIKKAEDVRHY